MYEGWVIVIGINDIGYYEDEEDLNEFELKIGFAWVNGN